ncbi:MAG TPA: hydantoinase/oxoprolinase family protein [Bryobacteraceae bacterium]|nr:hydantoinase/oxoprolinase family protein [Bryobacteraceae bacterium]
MSYRRTILHMRIGIDAGGTFTDFVVYHDDGRLETFKLRSNPRSPASVILAGLKQAAGRRKAEVIHGSTVATNALLERKGARTALVTTAGFEDVIHIGRQNRKELYNLTPRLKVPIIPHKMCFGVRERAWFDGTVAEKPRRSELARLKQQLRRAGVESVAICFLHAYRTPENEKQAAEALQGLGYLCCSHDVCPEFREYERSSTTLINAYVGPLMDRYLGELENASRQPISIMQSNGGFMSTREARRHAIRTVLSGPAGGVIGALETGRLAGFPRTLGFDMGGTSTDVSLCDGVPRETMEASVDGFPVRVPMLDIHTVGAGGGSIARVDEGGLLRVGPESAGADPGPACYGAGDRPTVTDAHVVLRRIGADQLVGGEMHLDVARAEASVDSIARELKLSRIAAAAGIVRVANANMERAIRVVSVERGHDPRDFALLAFGGCGGLHACEMAAELGIRTVLVPEHAGALSALGMLIADHVRDYAAGVLNRPDMEREFQRLERMAKRELRGAKLMRSADVRYAGQSYELTVPWQPANPAEPFHREHRRLYGYANPDRQIEIVTVRIRATKRVAKPHLTPAREERAGQRATRRRVYTGGAWHDAPVFTRGELSRTARRGPALVVDYGSTTLIPPGWRFVLDDSGTLRVGSRRRPE